MAARGIPMTCTGCGKRWTAEPKPDGSFPQISRCPRYRGGCGKQHAVPRRPAAQKGTASRQAAAPAWDPPSPPRLPQRCAGPCPRCGAAEVRASPRGTIRGCLACKRRVTPPGVLAPYERGTEVTRKAKSRQERDEDAKRTVLAAGEFLRQVRAMLGDPRIHPESTDLLDWYEEEITEARKNRDGERLAELGAEFAADREAGAFRRRHWWQDSPGVPALDDEDEDGTGHPSAVRGEVIGSGPAGRPGVVLATPASIAEQQHRAQQQDMTWAGALTACGWRLSPPGDECQVIEHSAPCGAGTAHYIATVTGVGGWVCGRHYAALSKVITDSYRARRTA